MSASTADQLQRLAEAPGTAWAGCKPAPTPEPRADRALLEIRHARLRIELADVELGWIERLLRDGNISPRGALEQLDLAMLTIEGPQ